MALGKSMDPDILRSVFDVLPSLVFVVDADMKIQECNVAASEFSLLQRSALLKRRGGDALNCLHAQEVPEGCGRSPSCKQCIIRNSVGEAFRGNRVVRRRNRLELIRNEDKIEIYALVTASPFHYRESPLVLLVIEDISEIAELQRLIPICCVCKKIRDTKESWRRIESYFKENWDVDFSHSYCPECFKTVMRKINKVSDT